MNWRTAALLFVMIVLSSCDSFYHLRYRQLDKVPASPVVFAVPARDRVAPDVPDVPVVDVEQSSEEEKLTFIPASDSIVKETADVVLFPAPGEKRSGEIKSLDRKSLPGPSPHTPARRDWSLLIGLLLIIVGLNLLGICIFVLPFSGIALIPLILLELIFAYVTWRTLGTGITYVVSRFRKKRDNRKES